MKDPNWLVSDWGEVGFEPDLEEERAVGRWIATLRPREEPPRRQEGGCLMENGKDARYHQRWSQAEKRPGSAMGSSGRRLPGGRGGWALAYFLTSPPRNSYREDPGSLWQPVRSLPSFFWPFGKTAEQSSVWLETKSRRLFLLNHFRITLHKSFYGKCWPVLRLTKCLLVSLPRSWILGKHFSFMITWWLGSSVWMGITKIVCLRLYYVCFRNARKTYTWLS